MPTEKAETRDVADDRSDMTLGAQLSFAVYKSSNKVSRLYRRYLQPFGLSFSLYLVLLVLWERAPCNVGDIVQALDVETNTVTPLLKRLQALGLVSRDRDPSDERRVTVTLTPQGDALRDKVMAIRSGLMSRFGMPLDQAVELRTTLHRLSGRIDDLMLPKSAA